MDIYKYGRLTLLEKTNVRHKDGTFYHKFKCDCGTEKLILFRQVRSGDTRSCGCLQAEGAAARLIGKCPTNKRPEKERAIHWAFLTTRQSAKSKKQEFALSLRDIENIVFQECFYCGALPQRHIKHTREIAEVKVPVNGIDRYDNSKGYTIENSVPCCTECNYLKCDYHGLEFIKKIREMSRFLEIKGRWGGRLS